MIAEFLNSWTLFAPAYLTALSGAILLSLVGVFIVARDQLFLAAAVSQISMLGVAIALYLGWSNPGLLAVGLSVAAALFINQRAGQGGVTNQETTGWVFLLASALAILLLAKQPFSLKEVQAMTASTMIGSTTREAVTFGLLASSLLLCVFLVRDRLVLWLTDPVMAAAVGMRIGLWTMTAAVILGLSAGLMLRSTGLLFTFGCLVLPALAAKRLSRDTRGLFWIAPLIAFGAVLSGLVFAHEYDFPPGQGIVLILALVVLVSDWFMRLRQTLQK
jgi:ABC-type Mn2+/Zn2+ transport system permease subunit